TLYKTINVPLDDVIKLNCLNKSSIVLNGEYFCIKRISSSCFDLCTQQPIQNTDYQQLNGTRTYTYDKTKHELEMRLIQKYS
ncbi:unnamed protein product, partial [Rotaria sp. Silwood1]